MEFKILMSKSLKFEYFFRLRDNFTTSRYAWFAKALKLRLMLTNANSQKVINQLSLRTFPGTFSEILASPAPLPVFSPFVAKLWRLLLRFIDFVVVQDRSHVILFRFLFRGAACWLEALHEKDVHQIYQSIITLLFIIYWISRMTFIPFIVCLLLLGSFYRLEIILFSTQSIFCENELFYRISCREKSTATGNLREIHRERQAFFPSPKSLPTSGDDEIFFPCQWTFSGCALCFLSRLSPLESRDCVFPPSK